MLHSLVVRDMLIVDQLDMEFCSGFNILTGETGSGKSILLHALEFVLGGTSKSNYVRKGADKMEVRATFHIAANHPVRNILEQTDIPFSDNILLLTRSYTRSGKKSFWLNNYRCSTTVVRQIAPTLIDLHNQKEHQSILDSENHCFLLDNFAAHRSVLEKIQNVWQDIKTIEKAMSALQAKQDKRNYEKEYMMQSLDEIEKLDPQPNEDIELDKKRRLMKKAQHILDVIARVQATIGREKIAGELNNTLRWLESIKADSEGGLDHAFAFLLSAINELESAQSSLEDFADTLTFPSLELEQIEERLFCLRDLARKHSVQPNELLHVKQDFQNRFQRIEQLDQEFQELQKRLHTARQHYDHLAKKLTALRIDAAHKLDNIIQNELKPLKMETAVFKTDIKSKNQCAHGQDAIQFQIAPNPNAPMGAIDKIASGGELSRLLLALKLCLFKENTGLTIIFDEIDRGIGGATADAVGRRLLKLSTQCQVVAVTHSPQIAAMANRHWCVRKSLQNNMAVSQADLLNENSRINEIARMISGHQINQSAYLAAKELLGVS